MREFCFNKSMISGYIDFNIVDRPLLDSILGDYIKSVQKAVFPGYYIARFEDAPDEVLDALTPHWGLFEWMLDGER